MKEKIAKAAGMLLRALCVLLVLAALGGLGWTIFLRRTNELELSRQAALARDVAAEIQRSVVLFFHARVHAGQVFAGALAEMGIPPAIIGGILAVARPVFDFRHFRAGHEIYVGRSVMGEL